MDTDLLIFEQFISRYATEAARVVERHPDTEIASFLDTVPIDLAVELVRHMNSYVVAKCLELMRPGLVASIVIKLDPDQLELVLRQCDHDFRSNVINALPPGLTAVLQEKLQHGAHTVGAAMVPNAFGLQKELTVAEAIAGLKQEKRRARAIIPVVDTKGTLEGIIRPHALLLADSEARVMSIMETDFPKLIPEVALESIANHSNWHEYRTIPVVDNSNRLLGMLDYETVHKISMSTHEEVARHILETSNSLGELYSIGLSGFLQSVSR